MIDGKTAETIQNLARDIDELRGKLNGEVEARLTEIERVQKTFSGSLTKRINAAEEMKARQDKWGGLAQEMRSDIKLVYQHFYELQVELEIIKEHSFLTDEHEEVHHTHDTEARIALQRYVDKPVKSDGIAWGPIFYGVVGVIVGLIIMWGVWDFMETVAEHTPR